MTRNFEEFRDLSTFLARYRYLKLEGSIGRATFGFDRYLNQQFYTSKKWRQVREEVILRDEGFDLGHKDYFIGGRILVHHMNPLRIEDVTRWDPQIYNPEFLISTSRSTHLAIHYGDEDLLPKLPILRYHGDTTLW